VKRVAMISQFTECMGRGRRKEENENEENEE